MKLKFIIFMFISSILSFNNCFAVESNDVKQFPKKTVSHPYVNLDGHWKLTGYQLRGIGAVDEDTAKANLGKIASIKSNIITLNSFDRNFHCEIKPNPKFEKRDKYTFWDPSNFGSDGEGGLRPEDFNFSDWIYVYKTEPIGDSRELFEFVVDKQKQNMILMCAESGFYLFERIDK